MTSDTPSTTSRSDTAACQATCSLADSLRLALRPKEAAQALGIGVRLLWLLTNRGEIPHVKLGKAVLYPIDELKRWLAERASRGAGR